MTASESPERVHQRSGTSSESFRLCQVHLTRDDPGQPFARAHAERLPCRVLVVHGDWQGPAYLDHEPLIRAGRAAEFARLTKRAIAFWRGRDGDSEELTSRYIRAFKHARCDAVLVEFGNIGVQTLDACRRLDLPLIVHFHGFDVHSTSMIDRYGGRYPEMFDQAAALVVVSQPMEHALLELGAPREKTHQVPNGVDVEEFAGATPAAAPPVFLAVGRFVEKKAPQLTIAAFASVVTRHPDARLRMIGDGRLLGACQDLAAGLGVKDAVTFLGTQPHHMVVEEMRGARAFVQHSLTASDGDSEGMPMSVLEASASGLPVVATKHAGIPEVVLDGETGLLVDERDVPAMTEQMNRLVADPTFAAALGRRGRRRIAEHFTIERSTRRLYDIIRSGVTLDNP